MDPQSFAAYFSGFFDGEGNLLMRFRPDSRYTTNERMEMRIQIQQKNSDVLTLIQKTTGEGKLKYLEYRDIWEWTVYSKKGLRSICSLVQPYVIVKKSELVIFEKILSMYENKDHLTISGLTKIKQFLQSDTGPENR